MPNRSHNSKIRRGIASVLLLAFASGCATPVKTTQESAPPMPPIPAPTVAAPVAPPPVITTPSVGPRPETAVEAPKVAPPPPPAIPPAPPIAPPVPANQRGRFIVLNFDNADIETVVHAASEIVGFNYVLGPGVTGKKVTVQTSGRIPQEDVFGVLLAILEVHGVTAVKSGNLYKIVPVEGARERAVPTIVGPGADATRTGDEIITQIVPIRFAPVNDLGTLLRPLISAKGTLIANRETGVLIITDSASNIARLLDIIKLVDVEVAIDELQIVPLQYADAADMSNILNQLFQSGRLRAGGAGGGGFTGAGLPGAPVASAPAAPGAPGQSGGADRPPLIVPERRSNSLIINARKGEMETIRRVIEKIDVNVSGGRRVFIYYAENAKSKDLAATLNAIYGGRETVSTTTSPISSGSTQGPRTPGQPAVPPPPAPSVAPGAPLGQADAPLAEGQVRFIADEVTNAIIVTTTPRQWSDIEATVKQLDRMPRQVLIEVLVAEITLTDDTRLGMDWALKEGSFRFGQQAIAPTAPDSFSLTPAVSRLAPLAGGGLTAFAFAADKFFAILNTLASENRVNIVSNPHVLTSENKKAVINVSTSVPIITGQQTSTVSTPGTTAGSTSTTITTGGVNQTVEYRDAGVVLTVTPRIGERGTVALDVKQEVNSVGAAVPPTNSPSFVKREAETSVVLLNNQTLVLGGLIQDKVTKDDRGVPVFKNIPILGYLFGFKEKKIEKTELLLMITPRVVGTALDAARITNEMRRTTPELNDAIRNAPRAPVTNPPPAPLPVPVPVVPPVLPPGEPPKPSGALPSTSPSAAVPDATPALAPVPTAAPAVVAPAVPVGAPPAQVIAPAPVVAPPQVVAPPPAAVAPPAAIAPPVVAPAPTSSVTPAPAVTQGSQAQSAPVVVAPAPAPAAPGQPVPTLRPRFRSQPPLVTPQPAPDATATTPKN
jgi:general secretion pathway protein D